MTKGIDAWPGGVLRIRVPLPFPLRWTNAYALKDTRGWTVIDPGIHTDKAIQAWKEFLEMTNSRWQDVHRIVLTHHHPDHYGLSGWMQAQSGAEVLMSRKAYEQTRLFWGEERTMTDRMCALFAEHGLDNELLPRMHEHLESFVPQVTPAPEVTFIEAGERIMLGGGSLTPRSKRRAMPPAISVFSTSRKASFFVATMCCRGLHRMSAICPELMKTRCNRIYKACE